MLLLRSASRACGAVIPDRCPMPRPSGRPRGPRHHHRHRRPALLQLTDACMSLDGPGRCGGGWTDRGCAAAGGGVRRQRWPGGAVFAVAAWRQSVGFAAGRVACAVLLHTMLLTISPGAGRASVPTPHVSHPHTHPNTRATTPADIRQHAHTLGRASPARHTRAASSPPRAPPMRQSVQGAPPRQDRRGGRAGWVASMHATCAAGPQLAQRAQPGRAHGGGGGV